LVGVVKDLIPKSISDTNPSFFTTNKWNITYKDTISRSYSLVAHIYLFYHIYFFKKDNPHTLLLLYKLILPNAPTALEFGYSCLVPVISHNCINPAANLIWLFRWAFFYYKGCLQTVADSPQLRTFLTRWAIRFVYKFKALPKTSNLVSSWCWVLA